MKNQYFGDINDYRKYSLLRILSRHGQLRVAVCWMLTRDDGRSDGSLVGYLESPDKWARHDPVLYDILHNAVVNRNKRSVSVLRETEILPNAAFFEDVLPDDKQGREKYFSAFFESIGEAEIVFFDPDNGIEVKSKPKGATDSSKYIYWDEIQKAYSMDRAVFVYQHFPRVKRDEFIAETVGEIRERTGCRTVLSLATPTVVFFLVPTPQAYDITGAAAEVQSRWQGQITVGWHEV